MHKLSDACLKKIVAHNLTILVLVAMCLFSKQMCFSDLQALGDLLMHTSGSNENQEHGLEYKNDALHGCCLY